MAGPTSSIIFKSPPSESMWFEIMNMLQKISDKIDGDDFWVTSTKPIDGTVIANGQPFGIEKNVIGSDYYDYSDEEIKTIQNLVGFAPKYELGIYAMCNGQVDHRILGELTFHIAKCFHGIVDFNGKLDKDVIKGIPGKIWDISYEISGGIDANYHICDIEFMKNWLENENFRMIK